jgi:hypothetical protein
MHKLLVEWVKWFTPKKDKSVREQQELLNEYAAKGYSLVAAVPIVEGLSGTHGILLYFSSP